MRCYAETTANKYDLNGREFILHGSSSDTILPLTILYLYLYKILCINLYDC